MVTLALGATQPEKGAVADSRPRFQSRTWRGTGGFGAIERAEARHPARESEPSCEGQAAGRRGPGGDGQPVLQERPLPRPPPAPRCAAGLVSRPALAGLSEGQSQLVPSSRLGVKLRKQQLPHETVVGIGVEVAAGAGWEARPSGLCWTRRDELVATGVCSRAVTGVCGESTVEGSRSTSVSM